MDEVHTVAARAARRLLQRHLDHERDYQVRRAISRALGEGSDRLPEAAHRGAEERQQIETVRLPKKREHRAEIMPLGEEETQATHSGLPAPHSWQAVGQSKPGASRAGMPAAENVVRKRQSRHLIGKIRLFVRRFLLWPTEIVRIPIILKPFIVIIWLISSVIVLYLVYVVAVGVGLIQPATTWW
jgi:hypothetical protein